MKKLFLVVVVVGFMWSCSGGTTENNEAQEVSTEEIEALEESTEALENVMDSADAAMDTLQTEIDSLLNKI